MIRIGDHRQFWSGFVFAVIGAGTLLLLPSDLGTAKSMGPGYFPMLLGMALIGLGAASMVAGRRSLEIVRIDKVPLVTLVFMLAGVASFSLLIHPAGLAVSILTLILLSCYNRLHKPVEVAVIYVVLLFIMWFIFLKVIQIPITLGWSS